MIISKILIVAGVLGEGWVWFEFHRTKTDRRSLSNISFLSGCTVCVGLFGYLTSLY